jgi:hypothetical protein
MDATSAVQLEFFYTYVFGYEDDMKFCIFSQISKYSLGSTMAVNINQNPPSDWSKIKSIQPMTVISACQ